MWSPQGWGPARNIVAFTGGDVGCCPEFYAEATEKIKDACHRMLVLFETNGWGLTDENLDTLQGAGLDSYWLDIKAFSHSTYKGLCGVSNERILELPAKILDRGFILEVLSLYIPGYVETNQLTKIAELLAEADPRIPFTLLAFFPAYKLENNRPPTLLEMLKAYAAVKSVGLKSVKLGNCHVFARTGGEWELLVSAVGMESIG